MAGNPKVFCSHRSVDKPRVKEIATKLAAAGIDPWVDQWEIQPGDDIVAKINDGLASYDVGLIFLSKTSLESDWVTAEANTLTYQRIEDGKRVIPVMIDADAPVPPLLRPQARLGLERIEELIAAIYGRTDKPDQETIEILREREDDSATDVLFQVFPDLEVPSTLTNIEIIMSEAEKLFENVAQVGWAEHLTPRQLEELLAETLRREGFESYLTPSTRDGGRDVIAVKPGKLPILVLGEAKKVGLVSPSMIHRLETVRQRDRAHLGILATTGRFSKATRAEASRYWGRWIHLKDGEEFITWIRSLRTRR